jgi:integrase
VNFDLGTLLVTGGELGTKNHEVRTVPLFPPPCGFSGICRKSRCARLVHNRVPAGEGCGSASREAESSHAGAKPEQPVCEQVGEPSENRIFKLDSAKKALITACRKAGLPHYGHHAMRHFFCSNAIEAGCDFKVIAEWLGHKDGGVLVARTYGHLRNEHSAAMAKRLTFDASSGESRV